MFFSAYCHINYPLDNFEKWTIFVLKVWVWKVLLKKEKSFFKTIDYIFLSKDENDKLSKKENFDFP